MFESGFRHTVASDIEKLRDLLGNQYSSQSVLRELLQNADDAESNWTSIEYIENGPGGNSCLLDGPALVIINDGFYRPRDGEALLMPGSGTKGHDEAAIGKFGLGIKSVFHLCEAFYFFASETQEGFEYFPGSLFNPWKELRPNWGSSDSELSIRRLIEHSVASRKLGDVEITRWFALYIPLRRHAQWATLPHPCRPILEHEPQVEELLSDSFSTDVADLIPLLRRLAHVEVRSPHQDISISLAENSVRTLGADRKRWEGHTSRKLAGSVVVTNLRDLRESRTTRFLGEERLWPENSPVGLLRTDPAWPPMWSVDSNGIPREAEVKNQPHSAVVFQTSDIDPRETVGSLSLRHAVFLPLEDSIEAGFSFSRLRVILHGDYFVDAGRRHIYKNDRPHIKVTWNNGIRKQILMPMLLPVLKDTVAQLDFTTEAATELTRALKSALGRGEPFWKPGDHEAILSEFNWLPVWTSDDEPRPAYNLIKSSEPYWALPKASAGTSPYMLFPRLRNAPRDGKHFVFDLDPRVAAPPQANFSAVESFFADVNLSAAYQTDERRGTPRRVYLKEILSAVAADLSVDTWRRILSDYGRFLNANRSNIQLAREIADDVLDLFGKWCKTRGPHFVEGIADVPFVRVTVHTSVDEGASTSLASLRQLMAWNAKGLLFSREGREVATALRSALANVDIVRFAENSAPRAVFGEAHGITGCDSEACLEFLAKTPELSEPTERKSLLGIFLKQNLNTGLKKACRYLLHGHAMQWDSNQTLYATDDSNESKDDVWGRLIRSVEGEAEGWRVIPKVLSDEVKKTLYPALGIVVIGPEYAETKLLDKLRNLGNDQFAFFLDQIQWNKPIDSETILGRIRSPHIFRRLPLHRTIDGRFIPLNDHCYLESKNPLPNSMASFADIIRPTSATLEARYREANVLPLRADHILKIAFGDDRPEKYREEILGQLPTDDSSKSQFDSFWASLADPKLGVLDTPEGSGEASRVSLSRLIRETSWLPMAPAPGVGFIRPDHVLAFPSASGILADMINGSGVPGEWATPEMLHADVREHPAKNFLVSYCFSSGSAGLDGFAQFLDWWAETGDHGLGGLVGLDSSGKEIDDLLETFHGVSPGLAVLRQVRNTDDLSREDFHGLLVGGSRKIDDSAGPTAPTGLARPIPSDMAFRMLELAVDLHQGTSDVTRREVLLGWYCRLLAILKGHHPAPCVGFEGIRLLNKTGQWCSPDDLCWETPNIPDSFSVELRIGKILFGNTGVAASVDALEPEDGQVGRVTLKPEIIKSESLDYLQKLVDDGLVPRQIVGAFLGVLANNAEDQQIADGFLGLPGTCLALREDLNLPASGREKFLPKVEPETGKRLVVNLKGEYRSVPVRSELDNLLMERPRCHDFKHREVKIARVNLATMVPEDRKRLWNATIERLLAETLNGSNLAQWQEKWKAISEPEQTELSVTQNLLTRHLFQYLKQGLQGRLVGLAELRTRAETIDLRREDTYRFKDLGRRNDAVLKLDAEERRLIEDIKSTIISREDIQQELLAAVRDKIKQFEYREDSIPFELFQNADDAAVEWTEMGEDGADSFRLESTHNGLRCIHFGRPINVYRRASFPAAKGQARGFNRDLEKMLVLQMSDKSNILPGQVELNVTGKFGLGFKSVFLYSDEVQVWSGDLRFRIVGAVFPAPLDETANNDVKIPAKSTRLDLIRRPGSTVDATEFLGRFRTLAPVQVVFARQIRRCEIQGRTVSWQPAALGGNASIVVGNLEVHGVSKGLLLKASQRTADSSGLLLNLGANGFQRLPNSVPLFWVTAPTRDGAVTGYAINGAFAVDVGRAQLAADNPDNQEEAARIGRHLGGAFIELYEMLQGDGGGDVRSQLGFPADMDTDVLWHSLWNVLSRPVDGSPAAVELDRAILWNPSGGYRRLLDECPSLPTGLNGKFNQPTTLSKVRWRLSGIADLPRFAKQIATWDRIEAVLPPGTVVSKTRIADVLGAKSVDVNWPEVTLWDIVKGLVGNAPVSAQRAAEFGRFVSRETLKELSMEGDDSVRQLATLMFPSEGGTPRIAAELLIPGTTTGQSGRDQVDIGEEAARAAFAPSDHRIAPEFLESQAAIDFLLVCRGESWTDVDWAVNLAAWGRRAETEQQRKAFLKYLANGHLARQIQKELQSNSNSSWLDKLSEDPAFHGRATEDKIRVVHLVRPDRIELLEFDLDEWLKRAGAETEWEEDEPESSSLPPAMDHDALIARLKQLAPLDPSTLVSLNREYDHATYPNSDFFQHLQEDPPKSIEARRAWMTLLLRGSLESMGRSQPGQHRTFMQICQREGWIEELAVMSTTGSSQDLFAKLGNWFDREIEVLQYVHWVRHFLPVSLLARHCLDLAQFFQSINERDDFNMHWVDSPTLSPAGVRTPPLRRILGVGKHFVLRELVRKGIVTNEAVHPHCFVPTKPLRDAARMIGVDSVDDYDFDSRSEISKDVHAKLQSLGVDPTLGLLFDIQLRKIDE